MSSIKLFGEVSTQVPEHLAGGSAATAGASAAACAAIQSASAAALSHMGVVACIGTRLLLHAIPSGCAHEHFYLTVASVALPGTRSHTRVTHGQSAERPPPNPLLSPTPPPGSPLQGGGRQVLGQVLPQECRSVFQGVCMCVRVCVCMCACKCEQLNTHAYMCVAYPLPSLVRPVCPSVQAHAAVQHAAESE